MFDFSAADCLERPEFTESGSTFFIALGHDSFLSHTYFHRTLTLYNLQNENVYGANPLQDTSCRTAAVLDCC